MEPTNQNFKEKYPEAVSDGEAFAETSVRVLHKLKDGGMLKEMTGMDDVPKTEAEIENYLTTTALPVALMNFSRDEKYNQRPDFEEQQTAFEIAFSKKFKEVMHSQGA